MKKTTFVYAIALATVIATIGTGCTKEEWTKKTETLKIDVLPPEIPSRTPLEGTAFPNNSQVGIQLVDGGGTTYNSISYHNIKATVTSSKWTLASDVLLSATSGTVYAYYPYSASVTDMTAIPVATFSQTDYMYATPATSISNSKTGATLNMNHALSVIRVAIKKGTYAGTGKVTAVSVKGNTAGTTANLNARTGELSSVEGKGTAVSIAPDMTLTTTAKNADVIVVPTGTESTLTLSMTIDGKAYSVTTAAVKLVQGQIYKYVVDVNADNIYLSRVSTESWGYNGSGNIVINANYNVTLDGNLSGVAVHNTVSGSTVTIKATTYDAMKYVEMISSSGTATVTQSIDYQNNCRTITVSNIKSNVTITFDGCSEYIDLRSANDRVYVVAEGYKGVSTGIANSTCAGVALITDNQAIVIAKEDATDGTNTTLYWGYNLKDKDVTGITNIVEAYDAMEDYNGKANTQAIIAAYTEHDVKMNTRDMCSVLNTFNSSDAYNDWYVPALGQLTQIYLYLKEVNALLKLIGGTELNPDIYWSSSESIDTICFYFSFAHDIVAWGGKNNSRRVRFVRDL